MRVAVVAASALLLAAAAANASSPGLVVPGGRVVSPALAGTDPITGKHVSLSQWEGRPLLVNLRGSWCHPCRAEAGELGRFLARHPRTVLGIDVEDSKTGARVFAHTYDIRFPSIFDPNDRLAKLLKAVGTPMTYFLDRRHRI